MDRQKGQIWYERALYYGHLGDEVNAKKAYAVARRFDAAVPPLPRFRSHCLLRRLERACLFLALMLLCWLAYLLFSHPAPLIRGDFPWWIRHLQGDVTATAVAQQQGESSAFAGSFATQELGSGSSTSAKAHTVPTDNTVFPAEELQPVLLLQTALYYYVYDHGCFPAALDALVEAGYLTAIPPEGESRSPQVFPMFTDAGGWVYTPQAMDDSQPIDAQVAQALQINRRNASRFPCAPLRLQIDRSTRQLTLLRGDLPLQSWGITIGAETTPTPTGHYRVIEKQILADNGTNPYGSRWMQLGNTFPLSTPAYQDDSPSMEQARDRDSHSSTAPIGHVAERSLVERGIGIHGTDQSASVGEAGSKGCVRMRNPDIEELYEWIPNGISVEII